MKKIIHIAALLLSIFLAVGVKLLFHACNPKDDGTWMHCHTAENAVCIGGIALASLFLMKLLLRSRKAAGILSFLAAGCAFVTALLPNTLIHLCMMTNMRCHSTMKPAVIMLSLSIALLAAVDGILSFKKTDAADRSA